MPKGYVEVLLSNSLLSANRGWSNTTGSTFDLNGRYTYDYVTAIGNVGVSQSNRFNAGVEVHYAKGYHDSDPNSSPMDIFKGSPPGYVQRASAVTSAGPRIKWRPFKHNLHFVYISTLQFPLLHNALKESILGQSRTYWGNQFLYSFSLGKKLAFFAQDDLYIYFKEGNNSHNQYFNALTFRRQPGRSARARSGGRRSRWPPCPPPSSSNPRTRGRGLPRTPGSRSR